MADFDLLRSCCCKRCHSPWCLPGAGFRTAAGSRCRAAAGTRCVNRLQRML